MGAGMISSTRSLQGLIAASVPVSDRLLCSAEHNTSYVQLGIMLSQAFQSLQSPLS
jgi:hypothetical protein